MVDLSASRSVGRYIERLIGRLVGLLSVDVDDWSILVFGVKRELVGGSVCGLVRAMIGSARIEPASG